MATNSRKLNLTRDQLAAFLSDQQQIRQFELLFATVDELQEITTTDFVFQADTAYAAANSALAQLAALAQESAINCALAENKANQALALVDKLTKAVEGLQMTPPPREFKRARFGSFYDTTTQVATTINTAKAITFNSTDLSNGVYIGSPTSRIIVDTEGIYNFATSFQLDNIGNNTAEFYFWFRLNGVDVPDSSSQIEMNAVGGSLVSNATGTGSQTIFVLTFTPNQIFINGAYQNKNTYTIVGTTVTFSTAPPLSSSIEFSVLTQGNNASIFPSLSYFFDLKSNDYVELMFSVTNLNVELKTFPASAPHPLIPSIILTVNNNIGGVQ